MILSGVVTAQTVILRVDDNSTASNPDGSTWPLAHPTVQGALLDARDRAITQTTTDDVFQIWVAEGTYKPTTSTTDRTASHVLVPGARMYGGFLGNEMSLAARAGSQTLTILSGDIDGNPRKQALDSLHVVRVVGGFTNGTSGSLSGVGAYRLDGFQIMLGTAIPTGTSTAFADFRGGGMLVNDTETPGIEVVVTNCRFQGCNAAVGGGLCAYFTDMAVSRSLFRGCNATDDGPDGAMPAGTGGAAVFVNCTRAYVYHSTFTNNTADYGGALAYVNGPDDRLVNCLVTGNEAFGGGGVLALIGSTAMRMDFSTIADNRAIAPPVGITPTYTGGGGINVDGRPLAVRSTILWGNTDTNSGAGAGDKSIAGVGATAANVTIVNSDVQFDDAGPTPIWFPAVTATEFNLDPLFTNPLTGVYTLAATSPCIDAADDRILDFILDLGDVLDVNEANGTQEHLPVDLSLATAREIDSPTAANVGIDLAVTGPTPIIADMGAYEAPDSSN